MLVCVLVGTAHVRKTILVKGVRLMEKSFKYRPHFWCGPDTSGDDPLDLEGGGTTRKDPIPIPKDGDRYPDDEVGWEGPKNDPLPKEKGD